MAARRRTSLIALAAVAVSLGLWMFAQRQTGLFNNRRDTRAALAEHHAKWDQHGYGNPVSRMTMEMIVRTYGGDCITDEIEWERVQMDRRLDDFLTPPRTIACYFDVGQFPPLPPGYRWAIRLVPISRDRLRIIEVSRQSNSI